LTANDDLEHQIRARPRILDFVSLDGLERLTGCTKSQFVTFIIKEMIDNALDKVDTKTLEVNIQVDQSAGMVLVSIRDDGKPQFTREMLDLVLDFTKAPSSKRGFKAVRRGVLGNALQCCFGISHARAREEGRPEYTAEVWGSKRFMVGLKIVENSISARVEESAETSNGTVLTFKLPIHQFSNPQDAVTTTALLNRHVNISLEQPGSKSTSEAIAEKPPVPAQQDSGDIHWYSLQEFESLAQEMGSIPVETFVTQFRGLKHRSYGKDVLENASVQPGLKLRDMSHERLRTIFEAMKKFSRTAKPAILPALGETASAMGNSVHGGYCLKRGSHKNEDGKTIPFAVEAAAYKAERAESETILEGINFTVSIHRPFTRWVWQARARASATMIPRDCTSKRS